MDFCTSGCVQVEPNSLIKPSKPERIWSYGWQAHAYIWNKEYSVLMNCGYCKLSWTTKMKCVDGTAAYCPYCNVLNMLVPCEGRI